MAQPIPDTWFYQIKGATRDLITRCGGVERAGELTNTSKSEVSRWQSPTGQSIIPLMAAIVLEADCGAALVTSVMASLNGRRLTEGDREDGDAASIFSRHADVLRSVGEMMSTAAAAFQDGRISPAEADQIDRSARGLSRTLDAFLADVAAVRGPRLVSGA